MADFNSNFNDIQKQIAVADLTAEQIQALVSALQNRRSTRPQLTKEEKVFFQCCREHRSYANDKDLDTVGQIFGKSENWACVTYHRARNKIKERLEVDYHEE